MHQSMKFNKNLSSGGYTNDNWNNMKQGSGISLSVSTSYYVTVLPCNQVLYHQGYC